MTPTPHKLHPQLEERLSFETLLTNLSARFVNVSAEQVDAEILDAQRRICDCLGLDASALWQNQVENSSVQFFLTAVAQNIKRLVRFLSQPTAAHQSAKSCEILAGSYRTSRAR